MSSTSGKPAPSGSAFDDIINELLPIGAVVFGGWALWAFGRDPLTRWAYTHYLFTNDPAVVMSGAAIPGTGPSLTCLLVLAAALATIVMLLPATLRFFNPPSESTGRPGDLQSLLPQRRPTITRPLVLTLTASTAMSGYIAAAWLHLVDIAALLFTAAVVALIGIAAHRHLTRRVARRWLTTQLIRDTYKDLGFKAPGPDILKVTKWDNLTPLRITMTTAGAAPTAELAAHINNLIPGARYKLNGNRDRGQIIATRDDSAPAEPDALDRLRTLIADRALFEPGATLILDSDSTAEDLKAFTVTHAISAKLAGSYRPKMIEKKINEILPGRWRATWDHEHDSVAFDRVPEFPERIGPLDYLPQASNDLESVAQNYPVRVNFAIDADLTVIYWEPHRLPHMLVSGATGSGKTAAMHTITYMVALMGWPIIVFDFKRQEFGSFRNWPNVQMVVTEPRDAVAVMNYLVTEMENRNALGEMDDNAKKTFMPYLVVIDEFSEFKEVIEDFYAKTKAKGDPRICPTLSSVGRLARLSRTARIHMVLGMQRPDASILPGEARAQFPARASLGKLDEQGAQMMWGDSWIGRNLPPGKRGRGMAYSSAGLPVEAQFFFTPPPTALDPHDAAIVAAVRPKVALHDRLVLERIDEDEPTGYDDKGHPLYADFRTFADAEVYLASDRPDLDPLSPGYHLRADLKERGVTGRRGLDGFVKPKPNTPPEVNHAVLGPHNDSLITADKDASTVDIGDYILLDDDGKESWVIVDEHPDLNDDGTCSITWRDPDTDNRGELVMDARDVLRTRTEPPPMATAPAPARPSEVALPWTRTTQPAPTAAAAPPAPQTGPLRFDQLTLTSKDLLSCRIIGDAGASAFDTFTEYGRGRTLAGLDGERATGREFEKHHRGIKYVQMLHGLKDLSIKDPSRGDIDHAIIRGNRVALIDTKNCKDADIATWSADGSLVWRKPNGQETTRKIRMSQMVEAYQKMLGASFTVAGWVVIQGSDNVKVIPGSRTTPRLIAGNDYLDDVVGWLENRATKDVEKILTMQRALVRKLIAHLHTPALEDLLQKGYLSSRNAA